MCRAPRASQQRLVDVEFGLRSEVSAAVAIALDVREPAVQVIVVMLVVELRAALPAQPDAFPESAQFRHVGTRRLSNGPTAIGDLTHSFLRGQDSLLESLEWL